MKNRKLIVLFVTLIVLLSIVTLLFINKTNQKEPTIISELAYNSNQASGYTIWIKENNEYVPYLVLTNNYGGKTLLLRKYLLDDLMPFNENKTKMWASYEYGGYYENSTIDNYLNTVFINILNKPVQEVIENSNVIITDKQSIGVTGSTTTSILRKIFILSLKELDGPESSASVIEGNTLKYFKDNYNRRIADLQNGEKSSYWTRTPETWETYTVFTIGNNGLGSGSADIYSGVRPAFAISNDLSIKRNQDGNYVFEID